MKKILITFIAFLFAGAASAQTDAASMAVGTVSDMVKPGAVISELSSSLDPKAFLKSFDRDAWKKNLDNISNPFGFSKSLTDLAMGISPEAFGPNWAANKNAWLSKAKGATTYEKAGELLKEFEGYLNPKMLSPDWAAKKGTWLKSVEGLK